MRAIHYPGFPQEYPDIGNATRSGRRCTGYSIWPAPPGDMTKAITAIRARIKQMEYFLIF